MKAKILLLSAFLLSLSSCNAQEKKEKDSAMKAENNQETVRPKGNWKVNREFDENGNLISYDSTYVYSYSTINGDTISDANMDEIQKNFRQFFRNNGMGSQTDLMDSFMNDSIGTGNFFNNGFFSHHMMSNDFQEQIRKMDSIHQQFLRQYYPQFYQHNQKIIPQEKGSDEKSI